ncbi:MAG: class II aldolase/adducin family protein [Bacillaceae bacterium]|nr:class II aldolase/adducin family protein [Bacillaceae bacterium]
MNKFTIHGSLNSEFLHNMAEGLIREFSANGYEYDDDPDEHYRLVFNFIEPERPRPFRRKAQSTFVVSVVESDQQPDHVLKTAYPFLIRSLSNHLMYISHDTARQESNIYFVTPEQGFYNITFRPGEESEVMNRIYKRLEPLASSRLVIDNEFHDDLPDHLTAGTDTTRKMYEAGKKLDQMNLLPAPFPIEEYLTPRDLKHLKKLYGIGGLSYGNLSSRHDDETFWMSASGVNKADLRRIGQDVLLIKDYDADRNKMLLSVPKEVSPKRASVDAIEHWMIYREHPEVGAIVHIHAWMDGVKATEINYPCGTLELAQTVADLIREEDDPAHAVIGLKNHGLTITGEDLDDIFERIEGRIIPQVPMS